KRIKHNIEIVIDRLKIEDRGSKLRPRLAEAVEQALTLGEGSLVVAIENGSEAQPAADQDQPSRDSRSSMVDPQSSILNPRSSNEDLLLSARYACTRCDKSYGPPSPQMFSFNSPQGMCPECDGLGTRFTFDPDLLIPDESLSFFEGAIPLVGRLRGMGRWRRHIFEGVANTLGIDLKMPWRDLPLAYRDFLLNGSGDRHITFEWKQRGGAVWKHGGKWEGIVPQLLSSFKKTAAGPRRMQLEK